MCLNDYFFTDRRTANNYQTPEGTGDCYESADNSTSADDQYCCPCPDGAVCEEGTTLDSLEIVQDYFRLSKSTPMVYECQIEGACVGGLNTSDLCAEGYDPDYPLCKSTSEAIHELIDSSVRRPPACPRLAPARTYRKHKYSLPSTHDT